jgi:hypothetical protein
MHSLFHAIYQEKAIFFHDGKQVPKLSLFKDASSKTKTLRIGGGDQKSQKFKK